MANTIQLKLLDTKRVECYINGYPYAYEGGYRIVAGEENATKFKISSVPTQYENATFSILLKNAANRSVDSITDLKSGDIFTLPAEMAQIPGYGSMVIVATLTTDGETETVVWTPVKLKIWSTNNDYNTGVVYIDVIFEVGEVETLPAGSDAYVENVGTKTNPILNFGIPAGYNAYIMTEVHEQAYAVEENQTFTVDIANFNTTPSEEEYFIGFVYDTENEVSYFISGQVVSIEDTTATCVIVDYVDTAGYTLAAKEAAKTAVEAAETVKQLLDELGKKAIIVDELPEQGDEDYLYLVVEDDTSNLFSIYIYKDDEWVKLGEANLVVNCTVSYQKTLAARNWADNSQTLTVYNLTTDDDVEVAPTTGYAAEYINCGVEAVEIVDGGVVFNCTTTPAEDIIVKITVSKQQEAPRVNGYYTSEEVDNLIVNTVKKTGETSQTVEGDIIVTGNITVSGTTYTNNTETLLVNDNMIVANGQGATLNSLSGVAIRTDDTNAYGIVYDPLTDSVKLGLGSLKGTDDDKEFEFNLDDGAPIAVRADDDDLTDGNILKWDSKNRTIVDSGVAVDDIAVQDGTYGKMTVGNATNAVTAETAKKVKNSLTIVSGDTTVVFDGSTEQAINVAGGGSASINFVSVSIASTDWTDKSATVTISGVTSTNIIDASAAEGSGATVANCYVRVSEWGTNSITFVCDTVPDETVTFDILILN